MYTAIVGVVMLAAFLEWFLWIAAFLYCLVKVFQKAEHWTIRVLAVIIAVLFTLFRYVLKSHVKTFTLIGMQSDILANHGCNVAVTQRHRPILA